MKSFLLRIAAVFLLCLSFYSMAVAQEIYYTVAIDTDNDSASGCDINLASLATTLNGIEKQLTAIVDTAAAQVTRVELSECAGGSFGPANIIGGSYPVNLNGGLNGADVVEIQGLLSELQISFSGSRFHLISTDITTQSQDILSALGQRPIAGNAVPIPATGISALILLALILLLVGMIFIRKHPWLLSISLICLAGIALAAHFSADGNLDDWAGETPIGTDPSGDASPDTSRADVRALFLAFEVNSAFFRIDIEDIENSRPEADAASGSTLEDTAVTITLSGSDLDGDALTFSIDTAPANGSLGVITPVDATSATVQYIPDADFAGADNFTYTANDGADTSVPASFNIAVNAVNDQPELSLAGDQNVLEDSGAQVVNGFAAALPGGGADELAQTFMFTVSNDNNALFSVQPAIDAAGQLTYTPADNVNGAALVTVTVQDSGGVANGGVDTSTAAMFTINVGAEDDPPVAATDSATVTEDDLATAIDVLANDTDVDGGPISIASVIQPANGTVVNNGTGLTYQPNPDYCNDGTPTDDFSYTLTPGSSTTTVTVTVTCVDDPPVAVTDSPTVTEDDPATIIDVLANDTDVDAGPISIASVTQPANGTVVNNGTDLTYQPDPDYCNDATPTDDFSYTLAPGGSSTMVMVTVTCENDPPEITSDGGGAAAMVNAAENQTAVTDLQSTDPDGDTEGAGLTYSLTGGTDQALFTLVPGTGVLTFTAAPDSENPLDADGMNDYEVQVTVTDSGGLTDVQDLSVTVTDINEAPVITSDGGGPTATVMVPESVLWAAALGGTNTSSGNDVAVDAAGDVYTIGRFSGTVDFDPGPGTSNLTSAGSDDVFVSKLDAAGNFVWAAALRGTFNELGSGVAVDGAGNVYTIGRFSGTVDFDPGPGTSNLTSAGSDDIFVSKLDSSGNFVWAVALGDTGNDEGHGLAVDGAGNVYIVGEFEGTVDFDPGAGTFNLTSAGLNDVFVSKLDGSGGLVWARALGGTDFDRGNDVAVDGAGNVYTTGIFRGTADFDPGAGTFNLTSAGSTDVFVSKLDSAGDFVWAVAVGGTSSDEGNGLAVDGAGNVYTTGAFRNTVDFDPGAGVFNLTSAGLIDVFASKLDSSGGLVWAAALGGVGLDRGLNVAVDGAGNVYTTGGFRGTADFDPGAGTFNLISAGLDDIFISKLDASGNFVSAVAMGSTSTDVGIGVAVDGAGNVHTTGSFRNTVDFDPGAGTFNLTSAGGGDAFVSKLGTGTFVTDVESTDPEGDTEGAGLTYAITGGADQALFTIDPNTGVLTFNAPPDFENPLDADGMNDYEVQVTVTDSGGLTDVQDITVVVADVNFAPTITSDGGGDTASIDVSSGTTAVTDLQSTDPDGDTEGAGLTYSLTTTIGGVDNGFFTLVPATGVLTFTSAPSIGTPQDDDGNNDYEVEVTVADSGGLTDVQNITVTVIDLPPVGGPDAFDFVGNTLLLVDKAATGNPEIIATTTSTLGVLDNDADPDDPISVTGVFANMVDCADITAPFTDCPTANGGRVTMESTGQFSYTPAPGDAAATDMFGYKLTGGATTVDVVVTLTRKNRVWYVKNDNASGTDDGSSTDPFDTLAEAEAASLAGDTIYVFEGDGTDTGQNAGIALKDMQRFLGEGVDLTVPDTVNGVAGPTLFDSAANNPAAVAHDFFTAVLVEATAGDRTGIEIRGLELSADFNAIDVTASGAFAVGVTITDNHFGTANVGAVELNPGSSGNFIATVEDNTFSTSLVGSSIGHAIDLTTTAAAGTVEVAVNRNTDITALMGDGIRLDGSAGGTLFVTGLADNTVHGNTGGTGVIVRSATFDADPSDADFDPVAGGTTTIGSMANPVGTSGVLLGDGAARVSGNLAFTRLDVFNSSGVSLLAAGSAGAPPAGGFELAGTAGTIRTATGRPVIMDGVAIAASGVTFDSITTTATTAPFSAPAMSFNNSTGGTFDGGDVTLFGLTSTGNSDGLEILNNQATFLFDNLTVDGPFDKAVEIAGNAGSITFQTVDIDGFGGRGIDAFANSGAIHVNGGAIGATNDGFGQGGVWVENQTATGSVNLAGVDVTSRNSDAFLVFNSAGTVTVTGGTFTNTGTNDTLDVSGSSATLAIGADLVLTGSGGGNAVVEIDGTSSNITLSGNVTSTSTEGDIQIGESSAITAGTISFTGSSINLSGGASGDNGVNIASVNAGAAVVFSAGTAVTSTGGQNGFDLDNVAGTVQVGGTVDVSNTSAAGIAVSGSAGMVTFSGATTVDNATVATGGAGVALDNNAGGTIGFSGALDIDATTGAGFTATGGGTVTATGAGSTVDVTTGTAVNIANTTIGAADVTFESVSANGGANGIVLNNTGTSGGLVVTGVNGPCGNTATVKDCDGGLIQNTTGDAVSLTSTGDVSLSNMRITASDVNGIRGSSVTNLTIDNCDITNNGDAVNEGGIRIESNLLGTSTISDSLVSGSAEHNIQIIQTGTNVLTALNVTNSDISDNSASLGADGLLLETRNSSSATVTVSGSRFDDNRSDAIQISAIDSSSATFTVTGTTFVSSLDGSFNGSVGARGIVLSNASSADITFDVNGTVGGGNSFTNFSPAIGEEAINITVLSTSTAAAVMNGKVRGNTFTNSGGAVGLDIRGDGLARLLIDGNTANTSRQAIDMIAGDAIGDAADVDLTITNNNVTVAGTAASPNNEGITYLGDRATNTCLNVRGNTAVASGTREDIALEDFSSMTPRIESSATECGGAPCADEEAHLLAANTITDTFTDPHTLVAPGTCLIPP